VAPPLRLTLRRVTPDALVLSHHQRNAALLTGLVHALADEPREGRVTGKVSIRSFTSRREIAKLDGRTIRPTLHSRMCVRG
jgi:hypothetical protein